MMDANKEKYFIQRNKIQLLIVALIYNIRRWSTCIESVKNCIIEEKLA